KRGRAIVDRSRPADQDGFDAGIGKRDRGGQAGRTATYHDNFARLCHGLSYRVPHGKTSGNPRVSVVLANALSLSWTRDIKAWKIPNFLRRLPAATRRLP